MYIRQDLAESGLSPKFLALGPGPWPMDLGKSLIFAGYWEIFTSQTKDAGLLEISGKFQICPVNPSSLSDNLSDFFKNKNNFELFANLPV